MQMGFSFVDVGEVARLREQLDRHFGGCPPVTLREPTAQMVKSSLGARTRDEVSLPAFERLMRAYPNWSALVQARADEIRAVIVPVTFADVKARRLRDALRLIQAERGNFDLLFLGKLPVDLALRWLERLPGVGRKVAASTLNFSTLRRRAFVIDTHILRVLRRFGLVDPRAHTRAAYEVVMAATFDWRAIDLSELHLLLKRLGQTVCRHEQRDCRHCPLQADCLTAR